jgi:hypothetical protein
MNLFFNILLSCAAALERSGQLTFGHNRPVEVTFQLLLVACLLIVLSGRYSASKLTSSLLRPGQVRTSGIEN